MSRDRAHEWGTNDNIEDGYLENSVADKRGYESDPTDLQRAPLSNLFSHGGNWYRKTVNIREGEPYCKPLGGKPLYETTHTVTLDNGDVIKKWDIVFKKTQPLAPSKFASVPNATVSNYDLAAIERETFQRRQGTRTKLAHQHLMYQREPRPQKGGEQNYQALKVQNLLIRI